MTDGISFAAMEPAKWSSEKAVGEVRWRDGILQQAWDVTIYIGLGPVAQHKEWRDVPVTESNDGELATTTKENHHGHEPPQTA